MIEVGKKAPAFHLADGEGEKHRLSSYADCYVVLYFYPKDDTSGCTKEACAFRDLHPEFSDLDAMVFGVSPDPVASHAKFAAKYELNFPLLADEKDDEGTPPLCEKYGVWQEKSMYGKKYMGVVRTTYLIAPGGKVLQRWDKVKVPGHAEAVLAAIQEDQSNG